MSEHWGKCVNGRASEAQLTLGSRREGWRKVRQLPRCLSNFQPPPEIRTEKWDETTAPLRGMKRPLLGGAWQGVAVPISLDGTAEACENAPYPWNPRLRRSQAPNKIHLIVATSIAYDIPSTIALQSTCFNENAFESVRSPILSNISPIPFFP